MGHAAPLDTAECLNRVRDGDGAAWGVLLERFRPYLTVLARLQLNRRLRGKADPDDVVQEAFLTAHRSFGQFRGETEAAFAAWLRRVLATELGQFVRRYNTRARDVRLEREILADLNDSSRDLGQVLPAGGESPSARLAGEDEMVRVTHALYRLPVDYREVLALSHLEGLPMEEVAARMGRSRDAVRKLWVRAVRQLRAEFGGEP